MPLIHMWNALNKVVPVKADSNDRILTSTKADLFFQPDGLSRKITDGFANNNEVDVYVVPAGQELFVIAFTMNLNNEAAIKGSGQIKFYDGAGVNFASLTITSLANSVQFHTIPLVPPMRFTGGEKIRVFSTAALVKVRATMLGYYK